MVKNNAYSLLNLFSSSKANSRKISIIASITTGAIVTDYLVSDFFDVIGQPWFNSWWGIALFALIVVLLYGIGQHFLIGYAKRTTAKLASSRFLTSRKLANLTSLLQYVLLAILTIIILEMILSSQYRLVLFVAAIMIGALPGIAFYALLGHQLLSWFRSNRRRRGTGIVLLLGLSASTGSVAILGNIVIIDIIWSHKPPIISSETEVDLSKTFPSNVQIPYGLFVLIAVISGLFEWAGITLLLHHFSKKIGKVKYWIIVSVPLIALLSGIIPIILTSQSAYSYFEQDMVLNRIMTAGGASMMFFMWGIGYLIVARRLSSVDEQKRSAIASYMRISAYGVILTGFAFSSKVFFATYPPFGVAGHAFMGLAAYLFSLGFYSSAISVSQDKNLRLTIRKLAREESSRLVDSIGTAEMEQSIEKSVIETIKANSEMMKNETGIEPSLTDEDIRQYFTQVFKELRHTKGADSV